MKRTKLEIKKRPILSVYDTVFSTGSCFSEEISGRFIKSGITSFSNPFGTMYNPFSIQKLFSDCINGTQYTPKDLYSFNGLYYSLNHSSFYKSENADSLSKLINNKLISVTDTIKKSKVFIITYGTSLVYKINGIPTANCHKLPNGSFDRMFMGLPEIIDLAQKTISLIKSAVENPIIFFTVSPVRHISQGLELNSYSKALLRAAVENVVNESDNVYYFPAYEIMLDELRDYRYYARDGIHPGKQAVNYIINKFINNFYNEDSLRKISDVSKIMKMINHRPSNIGGSGFINHCLSIIDKINNFHVEISDILKLKMLLKLYRYNRMDLLDKGKIFTFHNETYHNLVEKISSCKVLTDMEVDNLEISETVKKIIMRLQREVVYSRALNKNTF